jgi:predicted HAD superfamily Cof-like phosphohydrolase
MDVKSYTEPSGLTQVGQFHSTFKHPIAEQPGIPNEKRAALRVKLIGEELKELETAMRDGDEVSVLDALCDLQYVLSGTVLECGMQELFSSAFAEVHRSNMSKACVSQEEAEDTVDYYGSETHPERCEAHYKRDEGTNMWLVYRSSDDKTLKSINYSKADLRQFLTVRGGND